MERSKNHHLAIHDSVGITIKIEGFVKLLATMKPTVFIYFRIL